MNVQRARLTLWFFLLFLISSPLRFRPHFTNLRGSGQRDGPDGTAHMQFALWPGRLMNPFGS